MPRVWGQTRAFVVELDQFPSGGPFVYQGQTYLTAIVDGSVTWTRYISKAGSGAASFYATDNWEHFLVPGRVLLVEKVVNYGGGISRLLACFLIEEIEPGVNQGMSIVNVRGPGVESLLGKQVVWSPIGELEVHTTELSVDVAGPSVRSLEYGAPAGTESLIPNTTNSDDLQQEIRVTLDGGGVHVSTVIERTQYNGNWYLVMKDPLPSDASAENQVVIRTRRIRVKSTEGFIPNAEVVITSGANVHYTTVAADVGIQESNRVTLVDGLAFAAQADDEVINSNRFGPATDDVTQIIAQAPNWSVNFQTGTGTQTGTAHLPRGESVLELLISVAERTGEFWRYHILPSNLPTKTIQWRRTADSSGVTLIQYDTDEYWRQAQDEMSTTKGAVISLRRRRALPLVTKLYPTAGDQRVRLGDASATARNYATSMGCAVNAGSGLYEPDFVTHVAGLAAYGTHEAQQTYSDISAGESDTYNYAALVAAADQMLISSVQTLVEAQMREYYTVDAYIPVAIAPGSTVKIENATRVEPEISSSADWVVLEVTERLVEGRPRTTLVVSNMIGLRWTPVNMFAQRIRSLIQTQRRIVNGGMPSMIVGGGSSGGGGGTTDHGLLTGLGDDDHPQYLLASGARPLAANLAVNAGVTIDGVDISAHVANADAHHARVTAADASIIVNGQAVRVSDAFAGSGLALAGGTASVNTATAQGTGINSDVVAVVPSGGGGLQNSATGLGVKLTANSGHVLDSGGLALGTPGALTATSTNAVTATSHTHAVTATDNAKVTPATLLKGSAAGDLTLRYLTADKVTTPLIDTASGNLRLDPAGGLTILDSNAQFVGARAISTDTGSLTLSPAATLVLSPDDNVAQVGPTTTLKTAHAAVGVFPQTGWQIDYTGDAYFKTLLADALRVQSFIADLMRVKVGGEIISDSMALIRRQFTIPAVGSSDTLYVEDIPGWPDYPVFGENEWVLLRGVKRPSGGLEVWYAYGQVTSYADRADGEQSWTFTTRVATFAVGSQVAAGDVALCYGLPGSSWYYNTVTDPGGPHAGFATWYGANPSDNPEYWLRMGQLKGMSGVYERGFQTGKSNSSFSRFSELRNEIHGSRLSLYAGDGGKLQVSAVEVQLFRTGSQSSTLTPDGDGTAVNVETTGANYWSTVDEGTGSPGHGDYIANAANLSGAVFLSLSNPSAFSSIFRVDIRAVLRSTGLTSDTIRIYGQVFGIDETTPLTGEVLLATRTGNTTATVTVTAPHEGYGAGGAVKADWDGARLRLRWEYEINANEEAIRLDPGVPSLAVGNPLPLGVTGETAGGAGLWTGLLDGVYQFRLGDPNGVRLVWQGNELRLINSAGAPMIVLDSAGSSRFDGPMTLGTSGGIWQGTGTFAAPTTGLKIYNSGGIGRLSTYNNGQEQITINTAGQLSAGQGKVILDRSGLSLVGDEDDFNSRGSVAWKNNAGTTFAAAVGTELEPGHGYLKVGTVYNREFMPGWTGAVHGLEVDEDSGGPVRQVNLTSLGSLRLSGRRAVYVRSDGPILLESAVNATAGLAVGNMSAAPDSGALFLNARDSTITPWPGGGQLYVQIVGGVQRLYVKFGNGVVRELAAA